MGAPCMWLTLGRTDARAISARLVVAHGQHVQDREHDGREPERALEKLDHDLA